MTKTIWILIVALALGGGVLAGYLAGLATGAASSSDEAADADTGGGTTLYTCGMHPEVIQDHPGTCPQCGMKLTPLMTEDESADAGAKKDRKILYWVAPMDPSYVRDGPGKSPMGMDLVPVYEDEVKGGPGVKIDPVTEQNMGIRTAPVVKGPLVHEVRTVGNVQYDERKIGVVTLKVGGYIEKLHVDETGVHVKKGEPLFELYSPEVVQAQDEYLSTLGNLRRAKEEDKAQWKDLLEKARMKLIRWDVSESQIDALEKRGKPTKVMTWLSPFDGIVVHKNALEGAYVKPGEPLYRIASLDTVWVYVSIYEYEFPWVKTGQTARMQLPYYPGETFTGTVDYVYPYLDPKTRDRKVRLVFENPGYELVPDMYATVYVDGKLADEAVLVPNEAVLDTGKRQVVFVVKGGGKFDPRDVQVGVQSKGGYREVLKGLVPGDVVVTSGQFLLDSESKIKEAIQKMLERRRHPGAAPAAPKEGKPGADADATAKAAPAANGFTAPEGMIPVVGDVCPVMGGDPVPDVYADYGKYRVFFCCSGCPDRFLADPEKYMEKLRRMGALPDEAGADANSSAKAAPAKEPDPRFQAPEGLIAVVPKECPVMGGEPDPEVYADYRGHRFYFCCGGCPPKFLENPEPYIEKLRAQGLKIEFTDDEENTPKDR